VSLVRTANAERLKALCERHGRRCRVCWLHDDFDAWRLLYVSAAEAA
jgi:hypothetical protein